MEEKILKDLLEINTIKDLENEKIRKYIKNYLREFNFIFQEIGSGSRKVLVANRGEAEICFICHTDTVSDSLQWKKKSLTLSSDDDYFYGLGVSDMKGGIAALLVAIAKVDINIPCMICFTYDEECEFLGVRELLKSVISLPKTLIFTEPTNLELVLANKGCLEYRVMFKGKSAHSSTPDVGENALYKAINFIDELRAFADDLRKEKESLFEVCYTTFNLSKMAGGEEINKVPDSCMITFDFRTIRKEHNELIKNAVIELVDKYGADSEVLTDIGASLNSNLEKIKFFQRIVKTNKCIGLNYATEASFFPDYDIFILGPGPVTAHEADEKISKESYYRTIQVYRDILLNNK